MFNPVPSLPVFGTERPPVARITHAAVSDGAFSNSICHCPLSGRSPTTDASNQMFAPASRIRATKMSLTSLALLLAGKSFPVSGSSSRRIPSSCSKKARCSWSGQDRKILRKVLGDESVTYSRGWAVPGRMLQRPPPLMRIFLPPSEVRSMRMTLAPALAAVTAARRPAAPAPITATILLRLVEDIHEAGVQGVDMPSCLHYA